MIAFGCISYPSTFELCRVKQTQLICNWADCKNGSFPWSGDLMNRLSSTFVQSLTRSGIVPDSSTTSEWNRNESARLNSNRQGIPSHQGLNIIADMARTARKASSLTNFEREQSYILSSLNQTYQYISHLVLLSFKEPKTFNTNLTRTWAFRPQTHPTSAWRLELSTSLRSKMSRESLR